MKHSSKGNLVHNIVKGTQTRPCLFIESNEMRNNINFK